MKNIFFLGLLSLTLNLGFAGTNKITPACESYAKSHYLVKGSWSSTEGEDRLWDFSKLTKKFNSSEAAHCDKEAFSQALEDSNEYWHSVKAQHNCPNSGPLLACESAASNLLYLAHCRETYAVHSRDVHDNVLNCDHASPGLNHAKKFVEHHTEVLSHLVSSLPKPKADPCKSVPFKYRKTQGLDHGSVGDMIGSCLIGELQGIFSNVKDLFSGLWDLLKLAGKFSAKYAEKNVAFLRAIWNGTVPYFIAETLSEGSSFVKDLAKTLMAIPQAIEARAKNEVKEWQCLNNAGHANYVCKAMSYVGTEAVITILTGGALKASMVAKAIRPMEELMLIEKVAVKGEEAAKIAEGAKVASEATNSASHLKTLLKGKVPSEEFGQLVSKKLTKAEAREVLKKFMGKETRAEIVQRLHPDKYAMKVSEAELEKITDESALFNTLWDMAK